MRVQDFQRFQAVMATLTVTFGKELSGPLTDIYWDALKGIYVEQFELAAKWIIRNAKHFPKPAEVLEACQSAAQTAPKPAIKLPAHDRKWLALVNGMFLQYLKKRRLEDGFNGDIDINRRRTECLKLVKFFEDIEAEGDADATESEMKLRFDRAMDRICDLSETDEWLEAMIEKHKAEDAAKAEQAKGLGQAVAGHAT